MITCTIQNFPISCLPLMIYTQFFLDSFCRFVVDYIIFHSSILGALLHLHLQLKMLKMLLHDGRWLPRLCVLVFHRCCLFLSLSGLSVTVNLTFGSAHNLGFFCLHPVTATLLSFCSCWVLSFWCHCEGELASLALATFADRIQA